MPESNRLLAALFAAGMRAQFDPFLRCVELAQGEVLAELLQRMRRVYFPFSGLISGSPDERFSHPDGGCGQGWFAA
jgi:hypothetical protein